MNPLRVALAEMTSVDSIEQNLQSCLQFLNTAAEAKCQLLILPENSLYFRIISQEPLQAVHLNGPELAELTQACTKFHLHLILGSVPLSEEGVISNAMVLIAPNASPRVIYRKIHLFDVEVEGQAPVKESLDFAPGQEPSVLEFAGWKFGLSICYDLRFSELYRFYAEKAVDALLVPSAFLTRTGQAHWEVLLRARAIENQCYVLAPAQGGTHISVKSEAQRQTYGHSMVVDPWGQVVASANQSASLFFVDLDSMLIERVRKQIPMGQHRKQRRAQLN